MSGDPTSGQVRRSSVSLIQAPPTSVKDIIRHLGPGLIVAGSIVGSGELIATTATGAQAGYWLLWLIVIGCVIKVFVQVELGRFALSNSQTTMASMNEVPGPVIGIWTTGGSQSPSIRGNWFLWYWLVVFLVSIGQLGGIVGGVGQAMAISVPLTQAGREFNELVDAETQYKIALAELTHAGQVSQGGGLKNEEKIEQLEADLERLGPFIVDLRLEEAEQRFARLVSAGDLLGQVRYNKIRAIIDARIAQDGQRPEIVFSSTGDDIEEIPESLQNAIADFGERTAFDHQIWATLITIITAFVLVIGRYGFIQTFSTVLVASFTLITLVNLFALLTNDTYAVDWSGVANGLMFRFTPVAEALGKAPLVTALATFGIIGVGGNELVSYPYWCLEKGYARYTGPRDDSEAWAQRAQGWMRVMRWDAWCSMVVYTFATIAFYLLGAAILHKIRLTPEGTDMIRTLAVMYQPVFGTWAQILFLFGAFAVLYSTFFVANASHARVFPDAIRTFGIGSKSETAYRHQVRVFSGIFPFLCLLVYIVFPRPTMLVLASGTMQAIMLPMLSGAALYFRYKRTDPRITPGKAWDIFLWLSAVGMLIAGGWLALTKLFPALERLA